MLWTKYSKTLNYCLYNLARKRVNWKKNLISLPNVEMVHVFFIHSQFFSFLPLCFPKSIIEDACACLFTLLGFVLFIYNTIFHIVTDLCLCVHLLKQRIFLIHHIKHSKSWRIFILEYLKIWKVNFTKKIKIAWHCKSFIQKKNSH